MLKVRIAQRGITVFVRIRNYRARVGTWTYGSPFPGQPVSKNNPRKRTWCAWIELPCDPYNAGGWTRNTRTYGKVG